MTGRLSPLHCISRSGSGTVKQQCGTWQIIIVSVFEEIHLFTVQDILLVTAVIHWQVFFGYSCYVFKTEVWLYCFSPDLFENALHHWVAHDHFLVDIWGNYEGKWRQKELFLLVLCSPLSLGKALPPPQAALSCFRERVGEWGGNRELTTIFLSFSRPQTPHGQCNWNCLRRRQWKAYGGGGFWNRSHFLYLCTAKRA